jgi:sulfate/thiosulfate transport system ATP-binding protein
VSVVLHGVSKRFGPGSVLEGIDLSVTDGEFMALLGPSGSGKTTLLRIVAGLETPDFGQVVIAGQDMAQVAVNRRQVGFVFQNYALFRHMSVAQNIAFGLSVRPRATRPSRAETQRRVAELLELIQLPDIGGRRPDQLSGGQRQRVALARALAVEPKVLLLDEPFGALDAQVRKDLRRWLRTIHDRLGMTTLFVTHDQTEAMELADRVAVLQFGRLAQVATPRALHEAPASVAVFAFLGDWFGLDCHVAGGFAQFEFGVAPLPTPCADGPAVAMMRPDQVRIVPSQDRRLRVATIHESGASKRVEVMVGERLVELFLHHGDPVPEPGAGCMLEPMQAMVYPK